MNPTIAASSSRGARPGDLLAERLAAVLPKGYAFGVHHLSTPPTRTEALFSPPPGQQPDKTYCENHFLAVSVGAGAAPSREDEGKGPSKQTLAFALEVLIFTTAHSTIVFVSKADSTGYLQLLGLPRGTPSPVRQVASTFLDFLVDYRQRKGIQTVVNLFARAQAQYLFPGSVENSGKHVLDDRGLVKWWCRVLDPMLENGAERAQQGARGQWRRVRAYLTVPGLDDYEMRAFLPRGPRSMESWTLGHPLETMSHYVSEHGRVPPRCLIPKFPDDPKSRFADELDDEALDRKGSTKMGAWKSVASLEQFWEMMAFRQECSSGRLTGFIWVVFDPPTANTPTLPSSPPRLSQDHSEATMPPSTPARVRIDIPPGSHYSTPPRNRPAPEPVVSGPATPERISSRRRAKKKLAGRIIPREPRIKTQQRNNIPDRPTSTAYYHWPPEGRGDRIVDESDYKRIVELLLHLEFSTLHKATSSTRRWVSEAGMGAVAWGREVVGALEPTLGQQVPVRGDDEADIANITGLIRRKRAAEFEGAPTAQEESAATGHQVNVLGGGLVRKKRREDGASDVPGAARADASEKQPSVNVLGAGLVRKKAKQA